MNRRRVITAIVVLGWIATGLALPVHLSYAGDHHESGTCSVCQDLLLAGLAILLVVLGLSLDQPIRWRLPQGFRLVPITVHSCEPVIPRGPPA